MHTTTTGLLPAAEHDRLRTWVVEIAETLLPNARRDDAGADWRFAGTGGLCIRKRDGAWFVHTAHKGGFSAVALIAHLKSCSARDAQDWGRTWLSAHPGTGSCSGTSADEDDGGSAAAVGAAQARAAEILAAAEPIAGTIGETYLRLRGLAPPYPASVKFLGDARIGDSAVVGLLTAHDTTVGVQCTHLDPDGRKSLRTPVRQTFLADRQRGRGAVFEIQQSTDKDGTILIAEGLEDGLSLRAAGRTETIIALPGVGMLARLDAVRKGQRVIVVRDGDPASSPADKALTTGTDHLLLAGAVVRVTQTPETKDTNGILLEQGADALHALIDGAQPAELSLSGDVQRLAREPEEELDRQCKAVAKKHGIRVGTLRRMVAKTRPEPTPNKDGKPPVPADEPWEGEVDLRKILDEALVEVSRYIVAPRAILATLIVWAAHTHIAYSDLIRLPKSPRLHVRSRLPGSGKTTLMHCLAALSLRSRMASSFTPSSVLRVMEMRQPTLLLDEADNVICDDNGELRAILNAGDLRASAYVDRSVPTPDGGWEAREFHVWGPVAFAGINELPSTLQDRSISLLLRRALAKDVPEKLVNATSPKLIEVRRQLTAWGTRLAELPDAQLPPMLQTQPARLSDNWRPLFSIARMAGGEWPVRLTEEVEAELREEARPTRVMRLLQSIRRAFERQAEQDSATAQSLWDAQPDNPVRLTTETLVRYLLEEVEEEWGTANHGCAVTAYYLRDQLRNLLDPAGAQQWFVGTPQERKHCRGYYRAQFEVVWSTTVPEVLLSHDDSHIDPEQSGSSGSSGINDRHAEPDNRIEPEEPDHGKNVRACVYRCLPGSQGLDGQAPAQPTRAGTSRRQPLDLITQSIRDLASLHLDWSDKELAKNAGQPIARVQKALKGWNRLPAWLA